MSHSLHRRGTPESLRHDYILLVTAASGINHEGSKEKLRQVLDLVWEIGPINTGSNETGTILSGVSVEEIKAGFTKVPRVRCCFDNEDKMQRDTAAVVRNGSRDLRYSFRAKEANRTDVSGDEDQTTFSKFFSRYLGKT